MQQDDALSPADACCLMPHKIRLSSHGSGRHLPHAIFDQQITQTWHVTHDFVRQHFEPGFRTPRTTEAAVAVLKVAIHGDCKDKGITLKFELSGHWELGG